MDVLIDILRQSPFSHRKWLCGIILFNKINNLMKMAFKGLNIKRMYKMRIKIEKWDFKDGNNKNLEIIKLLK